MTTRPSLRLGRHLVPGVIALGFFGLLAWIAGTAAFGGAAGFPADVSVTENLGYALWDVEQGADGIRGEGFLVALEMVAMVLVAALVGAVMLARREVDGDVVTALLATRDPATEDRSPGGED
jgi:NADH:ubiquinone oxidoreductase subunit 6 (subunit J)